MLIELISFSFLLISSLSLRVFSRIFPLKETKQKKRKSKQSHADSQIASMGTSAHMEKLFIMKKCTQSIWHIYKNIEFLLHQYLRPICFVVRRSSFIVRRPTCVRICRAYLEEKTTSCLGTFHFLCKQIYAIK